MQSSHSVENDVAFMEPVNHRPERKRHDRNIFLQPLADNEDSHVSLAVNASYRMHRKTAAARSSSLITKTTDQVMKELVKQWSIRNNNGNRSATAQLSNDNDQSKTMDYGGTV